MLGDNEEVSTLQRNRAISVPFAKLSGMWKEKVFGQFLRDAVELSRSPDAKLSADQRNRKLANNSLQINNLYVHGTAVDSLGAVLLNGNLPRQVLGVDAALKNFPFHTDFIGFTQKPGENKTLGQFINEHKRLGIYGTDQRHGGKFGAAGQVFLLYDRDQALYQREIDYDAGHGGWENHKIILGGMPSSEITGIKLRQPQTTFETVKRAVVENGFYVPIYDYDNDKLIFTPEDYDRYKSEWNLNVPIPVWDYSLKIGDAKGSHKPAGEYAIPTKDGSLKTYYVKFANYDFPSTEPDILAKEIEEQNKIWNEYLADRIYHHFDIPVPETAVVKVNKVVGHASEEANGSVLHEGNTNTGPGGKAFARVSEMVQPDETNLEAAQLAFKDGFLIDALLANWDIAKAGNVVYSEGKPVRIDNGGALLFRARGERKAGEEFNTTVPELETMKNSYPGLSNEDIQRQLGMLREKFNDEEINQLVDSVRLHQNDRNFLRETLRQRRDYILSYYSEAPTPETNHSYRRKKIS